MNYLLMEGIEVYNICYDEERKFNVFTVYFFIKRTRKNIILAKILENIFIQCKQENIDFLRDLYDASFNVSSDVWEDKIFICLNISVLNDKYAFEPNENLLNKALEFLCNMILSLNTPDKSKYYTALSEIEDEIESDESEKENYIKRAFAKLFPDSYVAINASNSLYKLDDISYNTFSKFIKKILTKSNILIFGYGVYDEFAVQDYLKERFKEIQNRKGTKFKSSFDFFSINREKVCENTAVGDSSSFVTFLWLGNREKAKNFNTLTYLYADILQKALFKALREDRGLVYGIGVASYIKYSALAIYGNINEKNYDEVISCVKTPEILSLDVYSDEKLEEKLQCAKAELRHMLEKCFYRDSSGYIYYIDQNNFHKDDIDSITIQNVRKYAKELAENSKDFYGCYLETPSTSDSSMD